MKFVSHPRELCFNLLPGKVTSVSVGENTCAAVTGKLAVTKILQRQIFTAVHGAVNISCANVRSLQNN